MKFVKLTATVPFTSGGSKVVHVNPESIQLITEIQGGSEITLISGKTLVVTESVEAIFGEQDGVSSIPGITQEQVERLGRIVEQPKKEK